MGICHLGEVMGLNYKQKLTVLGILAVAVGTVIYGTQKGDGQTESELMETASDKRWWDSGSGEFFPAELRYGNPHGEIGVINSLPGSTVGHPFFEPVGENGRACVTCHQPADSFSLSAETVQSRWDETGGTDPLFAMVDGANCPNLPAGDAASHSLLLEHGLFRIGMSWPPKGP